MQLGDAVWPAVFVSNWPLAVMILRFNAINKVAILVEPEALKDSAEKPGF